MDVEGDIVVDSFGNISIDAFIYVYKLYMN